MTMTMKKMRRTNKMDKVAIMRRKVIKKLVAYDQLQINLDRM